MYKIFTRTYSKQHELGYKQFKKKSLKLFSNNIKASFQNMPKLTIKYWYNWHNCQELIQNFIISKNNTSVSIGHFIFVPISNLNAFHASVTFLYSLKSFLTFSAGTEK